MGGDAEVEDPASVMSQYQEYVEDLEAHSRNSEEVYRYQVLHVILQEGPPSLRWRLPVTDQVLAHAGLADVHTEFEQLAVNPGGAPGRVRAAHQTDQLAYVFRNRRTPVLAMPDLPCPKKAKAFPVPSDHSLGLDDDECGAPFSPHSAQPSPEEPVEGCQLRLLHRTMQNAELVPERKVFQLESGLRFAMLRDKFGTSWMILHERPQPAERLEKCKLCRASGGRFMALYGLAS